MKSIIASAIASGFMILAFGLAVGLPFPVHAFTSTTTIIGWLVPDGAHWNNGIAAMLFPIIGVALFSIMARLLDQPGDMVVTFSLVGLTMGALVGMLSINASSSNVIPFAMPVVAAIDLVLWLWQGGHS